MQTTLVTTTAALFLIHASTMTVLAQDNLPQATEELVWKSRQLVHTATPQAMDGNIVEVFQVTSSSSDSKIYTFIPYVHLNWADTKRTVEKRCETFTEVMVNVPVNISIYTTALIDELKRILSLTFDKPIDKISVSPPPNIGVTVHAFDFKGAKFELVNTLPSDVSLRGTKVTATGANLPASLRGNIRGTCAQLREIAELRSLQALMFVVGSPAAVSRLDASATSLLNTHLLDDLKNKESQVNRTIANAKSGSTGIGIKLGPVNLGESKSRASNSLEKQHYRIINREWLDQNIQNASTRINISQVCDQGSECNGQSITDFLRSFYGRIEAQEITIEKIKDGVWRANFAGTDMEVQPVTISEELKTVLNATLEGKEDVDVTIAGYGAKKKGELVFQNGQDIGWKRQGNDWVPTTLNAIVVNVADIENRVTGTFSRTNLGVSAGAAIALPILQRRPKILGTQAQEEEIDKLADSLTPFRTLSQLIVVCSLSRIVWLAKFT